MPNFYKIINEDRKVSMPLNENAILECIKLSQNRNKELNARLIDVWENLEGKKFSKDYLERF